MSSELCVALIEQAVPLLTLTVVTTAAVILRHPLRSLLERATKIGVSGILEVSAEPLRAAQPSAPVSGRAVRAVERRVERNHDRLVRLRVLWVDDHPENNRTERSYLRDLGVAVVVATSTVEALELVDREDPTVVITDLARGDDAVAGLTLASQLATTRPSVAVLGYVETLEPGLPHGFFGITNRPDVLIHLLLDIAERLT
ncbi:response regulator [Actinotalea subterranea]|uniref:response regulator n=1 Tax=Actinotalea subterranea TaxID=2607497 RepID=UPI00165DDC53|nr:response regulator [Actinotalea subterranea]